MSPGERESSRHDDGWGSAGGEEEGSIQLPAFLADPKGVFERRWKWMVAAGAVGLIATVIVTRNWVPTFKATSTILVASQQIPEEFVRSTVSEDTISNMDTMLGRILSQDELSRLIDEHQLFPELVAGTSRLDLVNLMRSKISAEPAEEFQGGYNSSLIYEVSYESYHPEEAADVANILAEMLVEASIARRNEQARRTTEFLRRALEHDEEELRDQAKLLSEFRRTHRGELPGELSTNLHKLDLASSRRESLIAQIAEKKNRISGLATNPGAREKTENETLLDEMRRELARELASNTEEHPNVIALRGRIKRLDEAVTRERSSGFGPNADIARLVDTERFELQRLQVELAKAEQQVVVLSGRVDRTPAVGEEYSALAEVEDALREKYRGSLRKVEQAELAETLESAQQGAQVSILDAAKPPSAPDRPRWMFALGGLIASFSLALGMGALLELVDPVVVSERQLEIISAMPGLGALPRLS